MRLFLAQSAVIDAYASLRHTLDTCVKGRWRSAASLHATVLFTGERFPAEEIIERVRTLDIALGSAAIEGIGRFVRNRILYASARHPALIEAHSKIAEALGMPVQSPYTVHVTLMRYKTMDTECFDAQSASLRGKRLGSIGGPLKLMKSVLTPDGARYETLYRF